MPDKPDTWARIWLALSDPLWQGVIMATVISFLRVLYDAPGTKLWRVILESLICGCLSLVASIVIEWMQWPASASIVAGGAIGFLGVTVMREFLLRFINRKVDSV